MVHKLSAEDEEYRKRMTNLGFERFAQGNGDRGGLAIFTARPAPSPRPNRSSLRKLLDAVLYGLGASRSPGHHFEDKQWD
jgi:hypothetical protein